MSPKRQRVFGAVALCLLVAAAPAGLAARSSDVTISATLTKNATGKPCGVNVPPCVYSLTVTNTTSSGTTNMASVVYTAPKGFELEQEENGPVVDTKKNTITGFGLVSPGNSTTLLLATKSGSPGDPGGSAGTVAAAFQGGGDATATVNFVLGPGATAITAASTTVAATTTAVGSGKAHGPVIRFNPDPRGWGHVPLHEDAFRRLFVSNHGDEPLVITAVSLVGADSQSFTFSGARGLIRCDGGDKPPFTLMPQGQCSFELEFLAKSTSEREATLRVVDNAPGSPHEVALSGQGQGLPLIKVDPAYLYFKESRGRTSASKSIHVKNVGSAPLTIGRVTFNLTDKADFVIVTDSCHSFGRVEPGGTCTITVAFSPHTLFHDSLYRFASLTIASDAANSAISDLQSDADAGNPVVELRGDVAD